MRRAYSLVEVLLALALAGFVGSAVVLMLGVATSATAVQGDSRRSTVARQVAAERLGPIVRGVCRPLAVSPDRLLLWTTDANGDGAPELSELRLIRWRSDTAEVSVAEASAQAPPSPDTRFDLSSDFATVADNAAAALPSRVLLQHVAAFAAALDPASGQRVRIDLSMQSEHGLDASTVFAAPRGGR